MTRHLALGVLTPLLAAGIALADAVVPGFTVTPYATVTDPTTMSFASDGTLYTGRDDFGSGNASGDVVRIHRIGPGGTPVEEYGDTAIPDPDGVLVDESGAVSGVAGSVLVCQGDISPQQGRVLAIRPDQTTVTVFGPLATLQNPNQMVFDSTGALVVSNSSPQIGVHRAVAGGALTLFLDTSPVTAGEVAVDGTGRLVVFLGNGNLAVYDAAGVLEDGAFTTGLGTYAALAFGPGGVFGSDLYATKYDAGELVRIDATGTQTVVGTGFSSPYDLAFGPDGALYVAEFAADRVVRIAEEPPPTSTSTTLATTSTIASTTTTTLVTTSTILSSTTTTSSPATTTTSIGTTTTLASTTSSSVLTSTTSTTTAPTTTSTTAASTTSTSTSTTVPPGGCTVAATFSSVLCRTDALRTRVLGEGGLGAFQPKLAKKLDKALANGDLARAACGEQSLKKARARLKKMAKILSQYVRKLGSRGAGKQLDATLREDLAAAGEAIATDVSLLRDQVTCPAAASR